MDVHRDLLSRGVPHEVVRLPAALVSADDLPRVLEVAPDDCVAVRCYRAGGGGGVGGGGIGDGIGRGIGRDMGSGLGKGTAVSRDSMFVAVLVRAGATPDLEVLRRLLGADTVRAATGSEVNAATEYAASLVCPVQLPCRVRLLADAPLASRHAVYTALGEGGVALSIRAADLLAVTGAQVATLTARPLLAEERSGWDGHLEAADLRVEQGEHVLDLDDAGRDRAERTSRSGGTTA